MVVSLVVLSWTSPVAAGQMAAVRPIVSAEQVVAQGAGQEVSGEGEGTVLAFDFEEMSIVEDHPVDTAEPAARAVSLQAAARIRYLEYEAIRLDDPSAETRVIPFKEKADRLLGLLTVYDAIIQDGDDEGVLEAAFMKGLVLVELARELSGVPYPDDLPPDEAHRQAFLVEVEDLSAGLDMAGLSAWTRGLETVSQGQVCSQWIAVIEGSLRSAGMEIPPHPECQLPGESDQAAPKSSGDTSSDMCPDGPDRQCIARALRETRAMIRACYSLRRRENPGLSGRLVFRLLFVRPGMRVSVVEEDGIGDPVLTGCVESAMTRARFPEVPDRSWTLTVPLKFVPAVHAVD